jgi:hypothetical protein
LLFGAKFWRHNVPPTGRIEKCCQLLETGSTMMDWIEERSSYAFINLILSLSLSITLNFKHFKQMKLNIST